MINARTPGNGSTELVRLVGTYDETGKLLFSKGLKNFKDKTECNWCRVKRPMMHRYAIAKKGEKPNFSEKLFCSVACFRKRDKSPYQEVQ